MMLFTSVRGILCRFVFVAALLLGATALAEDKPAPDVTRNVTEGSLRTIAKDGAIVDCPLKHTDVQADITGFIARVKVTQTFANPYDEKIEAVYVFPLPHESAVDEMTMIVGERRIVGMIARRAEARQIYAAAIQRGQTAALLEQERPNIFTQTVGNIPPKQEVKIEISYVDVLKYDLGAYEFHFPMVVGPRYIPGGATSAQPPVPPELQGKVGEAPASAAKNPPSGTGSSADTARVPDASRITPPVLKPGVRNGHEITLSVKLDAGVPIQNLKSINHAAQIKQEGKNRATAVMSPEDNIPNKDFVLRYAVAGAKPEMALLSHHDGSNGHFMLMIQPKEDQAAREAPPRELCFLVDVSGSMNGPPTDKVKETMRKLLALCRPQDNIQAITFASNTQTLFEKYLPVNEENIKKAVNFTDGIQGGGGTRMLEGVRAAIGDAPEGDRMRIVIMLTDGYIGNEAEIIAEIGKRCGDKLRFWCVGIGTSVNRFLVDGVAKQGGGLGKVISLNEKPDEVVSEMMLRIQRAQLTKLKLNWGDVLVSETYPAQIRDLWGGAPVIVFGQYDAGKKTTVSLSADAEGQAVSMPLEVDFSAGGVEHSVIDKVWARKKIEGLMQQSYYSPSEEVKEEVTCLALQYRLMSQYTSFVAVDEKEANDLFGTPKPPRRMLVPVPIPAGTRFEGFFGGAASGTGPASAEASDIVVPPDILAKAELGDHFETINPNRPDTQSAFGNPDAHMFFNAKGADDAGGGGTGGLNLADVLAIGGAASPGTGGGWGGGYGVDQGSGRGSFGQRNGGGRKLMVKRGGGSKATESSVDLALRWLANNQEADGHWDSRKAGGVDADAVWSARAKLDTAATSLALLAFLGAGHTEKVGQYKDSVQRAIKWLKSKQDQDGAVLDTTDTGRCEGLGHPAALAACALAEAASMAQLADTKAAAQKAIDYLINKHPMGKDSKYGWAYSKEEPADIITTGWVMLALKAAKIAGLKVDPAGTERALKFLDAVERKEAADANGEVASHYAFSEKDEQPQNAHRLTAIAVATRERLGYKALDLKASVEWFMAKGGVPAWGNNGDGVDLVYFYFGNLAAFSQGGEIWKKWNTPLKSVLADNQIKTGDRTGSWEPVGQYARQWGRVSQTAISALCLEVYYAYQRVLP